MALGSTECYISCAIRVLSPRTKRPAIEADHSLATSSEVTIEWSYTATPPYAVTVGTGTNLSYLIRVRTQCLFCMIPSSGSTVLLYYVTSRRRSYTRYGMCRCNPQNRAVGCDMAEVLRGWLIMAEHRIRNPATSCESHDEQGPTKQVSLLVSLAFPVNHHSTIVLYSYVALTTQHIITFSLLTTIPPLLYIHLLP